jgi:hypothetical protein
MISPVPFIPRPPPTSTSYTTPPVAFTDNGARFDCVVTNSCGSVTSLPATLRVPVCTADVNGDGEFTLQDLFDYLTLYFAGCP